MQEKEKVLNHHYTVLMLFILSLLNCFQYGETDEGQQDQGERNHLKASKIRKKEMKLRPQ
jgi:hypothetical protein